MIALSVNDQKRVRAAAMDAGADAFVLKRDIATELMPAIARMRGEEALDLAEGEQPKGER